MEQITSSPTLSSAATPQSKLPSPLQKEVRGQRMEDVEMTEENQKIKRIKYGNTILLYTGHHEAVRNIF